MRLAPILRWLRRLVWLALIGAVLAAGFLLLRPPPQDLPWTPLALNEPIGLFTGRKLTALTGARARCLSLIGATGLRIDPVPPFGEGQCAVPDGVRLAAGQEMLALSPVNVMPSCPVMASLAMWQWQIVQPAAQRLFGASVARIEHLGSQNCRRLYGRASGGWSEHASADAIDISGFVLSDGRRISVLGDWREGGNEALFLRAVRDGACRLFATVLSPDYNEQHRDHLHLDQAARGEMGWRACR